MNIEKILADNGLKVGDKVRFKEFEKEKVFVFKKDDFDGEYIFYSETCYVRLSAIGNLEFDIVEEDNGKNDGLLVAKELHDRKLNYIVNIQLGNERKSCFSNKKNKSEAVAEIIESLMPNSNNFFVINIIDLRN